MRISKKITESGLNHHPGIQNFCWSLNIGHIVTLFFQISRDHLVRRWETETDYISCVLFAGQNDFSLTLWIRDEEVLRLFSLPKDLPLPHYNTQFSPFFGKSSWKSGSGIILLSTGLLILKYFNPISKIFSLSDLEINLNLHWTWRTQTDWLTNSLNNWNIFYQYKK